eukprot:COSAG02_NODE_1386_length_12941_cov_32.080128_9_plen_60_part_00
MKIVPTPKGRQNSCLEQQRRSPRRAVRQLQETRRQLVVLASQSVGDCSEILRISSKEFI